MYCLFMSFAHFSNWIDFFIVLTLGNSLYALDMSLLSDAWFVNIFSQFIVCFLIVLDYHSKGF